MSRRSIELLILLLIITGGIALDQTTKYLILPYLLEQDMVITSFLNFTLRWNPGISFSLFANSDIISNNFLLLFNSILTIGIIILMVSTKDMISRISWATIASGSLGNLLDRIYHGAVMDFIDFHLAQYHFAVFNIADSCISIGAMLLILVNIIKK